MGSFPSVSLSSGPAAADAAADALVFFLLLLVPNLGAVADVGVGWFEAMSLTEDAEGVGACEAGLEFIDPGVCASCAVKKMTIS